MERKKEGRKEGRKERGRERERERQRERDRHKDRYKKKNRHKDKQTRLTLPSCPPLHRTASAELWSSSSTDSSTCPKFGRHSIFSNFFRSVPVGPDSTRGRRRSARVAVGESTSLSMFLLSNLLLSDFLLSNSFSDFLTTFLL